MTDDEIHQSIVEAQLGMIYFYKNGAVLECEWMKDKSLKITLSSPIFESDFISIILPPDELRRFIEKLKKI